MDAIERDNFYQFLIYLGEELIENEYKFDIYNPSNVDRFIDEYDDEIKMDHTFVKEILTYSNQLVVNKQLDLHPSYNDTSFLVLCICFVLLYEPEVIETRNTERLHHYSHAFYHSLGPTTYVQPSAYAGEGEFGLFAKRDILKNERFSHFFGKVDQQGLTLTPTEYIHDYNIYLNKNERFYISLNAPIEYNARYANCAMNRRDENARISSTTNKEKNTIALIASKRIRAGDEILVDYGDEYKKAIKNR